MDFLLISGDIFHIIAIAILLFNILTSKSTTGLSYRAQEIYLVVFLARYSDMIIVEHPLTLYLLTTRALLIALTILTIYYMRLSVPHSKVIITKLRHLIERQIYFQDIGFTYFQQALLLQFQNIIHFMDTCGLFRYGFKSFQYCLKLI